MAMFKEKDANGNDLIADTDARQAIIEGEWAKLGGDKGYALPDGFLKDTDPSGKLVDLHISNPNETDISKQKVKTINDRFRNKQGQSTAQTTGTVVGAAAAAAGAAAGAAAAGSSNPPTPTIPHPPTPPTPPRTGGGQTGGLSPQGQRRAGFNNPPATTGGGQTPPNPNNNPQQNSSASTPLAPNPQTPPNPNTPSSQSGNGQGQDHSSGNNDGESQQRDEKPSGANADAIADAIAKGMDKVVKETKNVQETTEKGLSETKSAITEQTQINQEIGRNTRETIKEGLDKISTNRSETKPDSAPVSSDLEKGIEKLRSSIDADAKQRRSENDNSRRQNLTNDNRLGNLNPNQDLDRKS
jgi:hypothetical protein